MRIIIIMMTIVYVIGLLCAKFFFIFFNFVEINIPIDKSWMNLSTRSCIEYFNGVESFLEYVFHHVKDEDTKINCPCVDYCNRYRLTRKEVHIHLLCRGIMRSYTFGIYMEKIVDMKIMIWCHVVKNYVK